MKTNIYAPFWIITAALPHMPEGSSIIATTSEQASDPTSDLHVYAQTDLPPESSFKRTYVEQIENSSAERGPATADRTARTRPFVFSEKIL